MATIIERLEHEPSYCLQSDEKQLRRDAADEIRRLETALRAEQTKSANLEAMLQRRASERVSRRVA